MCGNQDNSSVSESVLIEHWLQIAGTWWCFCAAAEGCSSKDKNWARRIPIFPPCCLPGPGIGTEKPCQQLIQAPGVVSVCFQETTNTSTLIPKPRMDMWLCPGCILLPVAQSLETVGEAQLESTQACGLELGQSYSLLLGLSWAVPLGQTIIAFGLNRQMRKQTVKIQREKGDSQESRFRTLWARGFLVQHLISGQFPRKKI